MAAADIGGAEWHGSERPAGLLNDVNGQQVTYNGHLLYTFIDDRVGQVTGQGVQDFFIATPGLAPVASSPAPASTAPPAAPGSSYGY